MHDEQIVTRKVNGSLVIEYSGQLRGDEVDHSVVEWE